MVCTGNCTLPNFCDSRQGKKKVTVGAVSGGSVGLPETRTFFFWPYTGVNVINPYLTNGFSHRYHLGESTYILRDVRCDF